MASISTDTKGNRRIQFVAADGRSRPTIYLSRMPMKTAQTVKNHVEAIVASQSARTPIDRRTAQWLGDIESTLYEKLASAGLVPKRAEAERATLGAYIDAYIESRTDVKGPTRDLMRQARGKLLAFFGPDKPLGEITAGDADEFRVYTMRVLGENTARRMCGRAKQFFRAAARKKLIPESPFGDMRGTSVRANKEREFFVTREMAQRVLDACPDAQWRLLFALSRFGGLRCPSEHLALRWGDVDWDRSRMTVHAPKTEHHEGKESRVIPIFPELREHLDAAWDLAERGAEFIITRYRDPNANLRTQLERIIRKAGLKPWQKPFQNLRSTRETELAETFPIHVVCAWIGNSEAVARKHYLQLTDEHFEQATQNPTQHAAGRGRTDSHGKTPIVTFPAENDISRGITGCQAAQQGFEP